VRLAGLLGRRVGCAHGVGAHGSVWEAIKNAVGGQGTGIPAQSVAKICTRAQSLAGTAAAWPAWIWTGRAEPPSVGWYW